MLRLSSQAFATKHGRRAVGLRLRSRSIFTLSVSLLKSVGVMHV